jgi:glutamine synthetase
MQHGQRRRSPQHPHPSDQYPEEVARLLDRVGARGVRFVNLEFTDVVGTAKCVTIPSDLLADCLEHGKWFDGSSIENFARVAETDMYLHPVLSTFAELPSPCTAEVEGESVGPCRVGRLICKVLTPTGIPFMGDPRVVLQGVLDTAEAQGYRYEIAPELEFFLLGGDHNEPFAPPPDDRGGYFDLSITDATTVCQEITAELRRMGLGIESSHHEVAGGQYEIDFAFDNALKIADSIVTARYMIKTIARRHQLWATFLPKPFFGRSGSGMHVHQRLIEISSNLNTFADARDQQYDLSPIGRYFIAGQLAHARGMCAVVAPLVNSYKRLVRGFEAPVAVAWAHWNRGALVRVPIGSDEGKPTLGIELRSPDPSCNPYLAFAAMLRAGLDGIAQRLLLPTPIEENLIGLDEATRLQRGIELLPTTLGEALNALENDEVVQHALGELIWEWFKEAKAKEWEEYCQQVHPWELKKYLQVF